jgi:hypothetical protein
MTQEDIRVCGELMAQLRMIIDKPATLSPDTREKLIAWANEIDADLLEQEFSQKFSSAA